MRLLRFGLPAGALALAGVLFSPAARADDPPAMPPAGGEPAKPPPQSGRFFDTYDTNSDGKVTKEEFLAGKGEEDTFALLDTNHDGVVSLEELGLPVNYMRTDPQKEVEEPAPGMGAEGYAKRLENWKRKFAVWDVDKDGKVTKEEYKDKAPFERWDVNKDGVLTMADAPGAGGKGMGGAMPTPAERLARFKEMDKNGDGKWSKEEWPGRPEMFSKFDKDGDGFVTPEEAEAGMKELGMGGGDGPRMRFQRFDADKDGKLSREEFKGDDESFKGLDANGDGFLTPNEFDKGAGGKRPGKGPGGGLPGMPPPPPGGDGMPPPPMGGDGMGAPPPRAFSAGFAIMDKNKDGKISREEFPGTDAEWKDLDKDGNGWITPEEAR